MATPRSAGARSRTSVLDHWYGRAFLLIRWADAGVSALLSLVDDLVLNRGG